MSWPMAFGSLLTGSERPPSETVKIGGRLRGERVLVPILIGEERSAMDQIRVGITIAREMGGTVELADATSPGRDSVELASPIDTQATEVALTWAREQIADVRASPSTGVLAGRRIERRVRDWVRAGQHDVLVLPRGEDDRTVSSRRLERLAGQAPCNVISVNGDAGFRDFASILLPIANGPHSGLATDVAGVIAEASDAYVDVLHVIPPESDVDTRTAAQERTETAVERIGMDETVSTWVLEAPDAADAIVEQSAYYGLTVIGAPSVGRLHRFVYGSTSQSIREDADSFVIAARARTTVI